MRILISGGAGSIGVHVINHMIKSVDADITVLDSFRHKGYRDRLEKLRDFNIPLDGLKVLQHDLSCPISPQLAEQIGPVDHILHLAAMSDVYHSIENPVSVIKNNIDSTLTMLEFARTLPELSTFLYFSTDETLGPVVKGGAHAEWDTHRPSNAYAASKAASEDICHAYWRSYGLPLVLTRTMNNAGFMQSSAKFPVIVQNAVANNRKVYIHGNEEDIGTRFYIDSRDTADALLYILTTHPAYRHRLGELDEPDTYHIVGERAISNLELAQCIAEHMEAPLDYELVDFHAHNPAHDIHYGLLNNNLAWKPAVPFEQRLKEIVEWQKENPEWLK